jgi:Ca2+-binding RTX toxin-like protein
VRDEFTGSFQYDAEGKLSGAVITGWAESYNGESVFRLTGLNITFEDFYDWVVNGDDADAARTIFVAADHMTGGSFGDTMAGFTGNDTLMGQGGADILEGGAGLDYLRGGDGNDSLSGGEGFDDLHGNVGDDTVNGGLGSDWVVGGQGNDVLIGGDDLSDNVLYGNLGNDTQTGGGGVDWIRGGQGHDSLAAGGGADLIWGDRGDDTISGGGGADVFSIFGEAGIDRILDFNAAEGDRLKVEAGYTYTTAQVGADVLVSVSGGAQAVLVGVQLGGLPAGWII